jgi:hypothetical protein
MKNIHINNSYNTWSTKKMKHKIDDVAFNVYNTLCVEGLLNRTYRSMYIEWWLHNIGYYVTKPFCRSSVLCNINLRCKDVDLEEWT